MNHEEQKLQMQCVAWFRAQYPQYAMLLTHPINEGGRNTGKTGGIHKAEGTQAGVPDLLLFMPSNIEVKLEVPVVHYKRTGSSAVYDRTDNTAIMPIYGLGIEFKTPKGSQSRFQKDFQKIFEAAGYRYVVVRGFDQFRDVMNEYIGNACTDIRKQIASAHVEIEQAARQREKEKFLKVIGKKQCLTQLK